VKGLRDLLADAVPELPEVDRVAEVGRRVRRRRRARGAVATGLVVALTAGALAGAQLFGSVREENPVATPPLALTPVLDCPSGVKERPFPAMEAEGPVADESAVNALLCVHGAGTHISYRAEIKHDVATVVRAMNALVPKKMWEMRNWMCRGPARAEYQIVLGYPDGSRQVVRIDLNCGILSRDEVLRYGDVTRPLEEFAAIVRADGREFPYPVGGHW
jgi:hypothetical protein